MTSIVTDLEDIEQSIDRTLTGFRGYYWDRPLPILDQLVDELRDALKGDLRSALLVRSGYDGH